MLTLTTSIQHCTADSNQYNRVRKRNESNNIYKCRSKISLFYKACFVCQKLKEYTKTNKGQQQQQ